MRPCLLASLLAPLLLISTARCLPAPASTHVQLASSFLERRAVDPYAAAQPQAEQMAQMGQASMMDQAGMMGGQAGMMSQARGAVSQRFQGLFAPISSAWKRTIFSKEYRLQHHQAHVAALTNGQRAKLEANQQKLSMAAINKAQMQQQAMGQSAYGSAAGAAF